MFNNKILMIQKYQIGHGRTDLYYARYGIDALRRNILCDFRTTPWCPYLGDIPITDPTPLPDPRETMQVLSQGICLLDGSIKHDEMVYDQTYG